MKHLELHIIQSVPVACLNRDDLNSPKTAIFGGVQQARVSSQSWKRAIREMAEKELDPFAGDDVAGDLSSNRHLARFNLRIHHRLLTDVEVVLRFDLTFELSFDHERLLETELSFELDIFRENRIDLDLVEGTNP